MNMWNKRHIAQAEYQAKSMAKIEPTISHQAMTEKINRDVAAYLNRGGRIQEIASAATRPFRELQIDHMLQNL